MSGVRDRRALTHSKGHWLCDLRHPAHTTALPPRPPPASSAMGKNKNKSKEIPLEDAPAEAPAEVLAEVAEPEMEADEPIAGEKEPAPDKVSRRHHLTARIDGVGAFQRARDAAMISNDSKKMWSALMLP